MNNILQSIIDSTRKRVELKKELFPVKLLEQAIAFSAPCLKLSDYLKREDLQPVIAEFKRKSPSKGMLNEYADVETVTVGYMQAGSAALSVVTEPEFFCGQVEDIMIARRFNYCPVLRKDFMVDEYQIIESKALGADVVLLLANVLTSDEINNLGQLAKSLGMQVLVEIYSANESDKISGTADIIGINNRNLNDFGESIFHSVEIYNQIKPSIPVISESGIQSVEDAFYLLNQGFSGLLMGEYFMRNARPERVCGTFIRELRSRRNITEPVHEILQNEM